MGHPQMGHSRNPFAVRYVVNGCETRRGGLAAVLATEGGMQEVATALGGSGQAPFLCQLNRAFIFNSSAL